MSMVHSFGNDVNSKLPFDFLPCLQLLSSLKTFLSDPSASMVAYFTSSKDPQRTVPLCWLKSVAVNPINSINFKLYPAPVQSTVYSVKRRFWYKQPLSILYNIPGRSWWAKLSSLTFTFTMWGSADFATNPIKSLITPNTLVSTLVWKQLYLFVLCCRDIPPLIPALLISTSNTSVLPISASGGFTDLNNIYLYCFSTSVCFGFFQSLPDHSSNDGCLNKCNIPFAAVGVGGFKTNTLLAPVISAFSFLLVFLSFAFGFSSNLITLRKGYRRALCDYAPEQPVEHL